MHGCSQCAAGFLKPLSCGHMHVCMYVCIIIGVLCYFQFHFMALTVDTIDCHGFSNEMPLQLQPKKTKVRHY